MFENPFETPHKKPYAFGEKYEAKDLTRDYTLCPTCGKNCKDTMSMKMDPETSVVKSVFHCDQDGDWMLNPKTGIIENPSDEPPQ